MWQFIQDSWKELTAFFIASFGIWKYLDSRKRELKWKKTEFLFIESKYLSDDRELSECIQILEERHPKYSIHDIYPDVDINETAELLEYRHKFEKLLNFFDRLAYSLYAHKTIQKEDLEYYGWYLKLIRQNQDMVDYCNKYGFGDVIKLANDIC